MDGWMDASTKVLLKLRGEQWTHIGGFLLCFSLQCPLSSLLLPSMGHRHSLPLEQLFWPLLGIIPQKRWSPPHQGNGHKSPNHLVFIVGFSPEENKATFHQELCHLRVIDPFLNGLKGEHKYPLLR